MMRDNLFAAAHAQTEENTWPLMKPIVFAEIMDFFAEGKKVMLDEPVITDTTILDDDDEVVAMIKELLQERVRVRRGELRELESCVVRCQLSFFSSVRRSAACVSLQSDSG